MWHNPLIIIHYFSGIATVMSVFHVLFSVPNHIYFSKYAFRLLPIIITQDSERLFILLTRTRVFLPPFIIILHSNIYNYFVSKHFFCYELYFLIISCIVSHFASMSSTSLNCVRHLSRLWFSLWILKYVSP